MNQFLNLYSSYIYSNEPLEGDVTLKKIWTREL